MLVLNIWSPACGLEFRHLKSEFLSTLLEIKLIRTSFRMGEFQINNLIVQYTKATQNLNMYVNFKKTNKEMNTLPIGKGGEGGSLSYGFLSPLFLKKKKNNYYLLE